MVRFHKGIHYQKKQKRRFFLQNDAFAFLRRSRHPRGGVSNIFETGNGFAEIPISAGERAAGREGVGFLGR
jgi:hypothetical protein